MILQALYEYYRRKAADPQSNVALEGWEWKEIPFLAVIDMSGKFVCFNDTREDHGKRRRAHLFLVPTLGEKKGNGIKSNFLWENIEYMFGIPVSTKAKPKSKPERVREEHIAFQEKVNSLSGEFPAIKALKNFVFTDQSKVVMKDKFWETVLSTNQNILIAIENDKGIVPISDIPEIRQAIDNSRTPLNNTGICLITGYKTEIARLEPPIKGVAGSDRKAERAFVSFNKDVFCSYHKIKNFNAPIGKGASFAYSTALNSLLYKDSPNKIFVSDATAVFWAEKKPEISNFDFEAEFAWIITDSPKDDPDRGIRAVRGLYESIHTGKLPENSENRFYILGLSPNAARVSVRFWKIGTVREFGERIIQHFDDLEIKKVDYERPYCTLNELLAMTSIETKDSKKPNAVYFRGKFYDVPPNLAGAVVESILDGTPYPVTLLHQCVRRIRAEITRKDKNGKLLENVNRPRAAILKAYLNRNYRKNNLNKKELLMALDPENTEVGYVLGRLFALLERIQEESARPTRLNSTIRERYYGSFSSSPIAVMPLLLKLKNHHLAKLNGGLKHWFETKLAEVVDLLNPVNIQAHLPLDQQALFAVGYYHQRNHKEEKRTNQ